jgi:hypothetical protein
MDGGNEKGVAIELYFKAGLSATETLVLMQMYYGNTTLNCSEFFMFYSRFRDRK